MVICLEWDVDLHMAQLMPLPLTVFCFSKIQIGFTFLVPAHPGSPGKRAVKRVYVSMYVCCDCYIVRLPAAFLGKVHTSHIFPHKLAFLTAILISLVFLLLISIRFRYLNHLVANRIAPYKCPDPCGIIWGSWFQAILYHISTYFCSIFGVYAVRILFLNAAQTWHS